MNHLFATKQRYLRGMLACLMTAWGGTSAMAGPAEPAGDGSTPAPAAEGVQGSPDIVGIRTGIPLKEAVALLKKYNPQIEVKYTGDRTAAGSAKLETKKVGRREVESREDITLQGTTDAPHRIISITRTMNGLFEEGPTHQQFLEKYGQPTQYTPVRRVEGVVPTLPVWHYDASGHACPPTQSGPALGGCKPALTVEMRLTGNIPTGGHLNLGERLYVKMVDLALQRADQEAQREQAKAKRDQRIQEIQKQADSKLKL